MAVDPKQMALAQSIAQFGSAGKQQMQEQQAQAATPKQATLNDVAARAGVVNAPDAFLKQAAAQSGKVFDNASSSAANNSAALNSYMGSLNGAQGNYMSQLQAAVPLAQAEVDKAAGTQNLSQMMQLLNLKNSQEDRAYGQQLHKTQLDQLTQDTNDKKVAQSALNSILTNPNADLRDTGIDIINSAESLPAALALLSDKDTKKNMQKQGIDETELRKYITQYYDPTTYQALSTAGVFNPPVAASASAPAPKTKAPGAKKESALDKFNGGLPSWMKLGSA